MEVNIVNQTNDDTWMQYADSFEAILNKCAQVLQIDTDCCCSLIFVDAKQIHEINRDYRQIDRPTDVISFAIHDAEDEMELAELEEELGDIFINIEAVAAQAKEYGHSEKRELAFLVVHGLLHLLGYDHQTEEEEKVMFQIQEEMLNEEGISR